MRHLPTGTVTFLFTDVEGSTRLIEELGEEGFGEALTEHRRLVRHVFSSHGGVEVDTQGDAFFYVFAYAGEAVAAAEEAQGVLAEGPVRIRIGLHTGTPHLTGEGYVGRELHRAARIAAVGHGGQVVVSATTAALVDGELTELGEHRLKDFAEPVALFQLGDERFPPLKTISNTNLPRPASTFVGRERELTELTDLLRAGARLVTLSGPGGSGKTRLAIEAASELVPEFKAGVFWVPLATLRDPALVQEEIAQVLGANDGLADHIAERELLLLLDNLEQVVEAAPGLGGLLEACPNLMLVVTSRELLRIRGEREYAVPPLRDDEAVSLFCERAEAEPDETIKDLCRRLDNLPLAIELAAARSNVLSPKQILERLAKRLDLLRSGRDAEARQQTLRAAIEWSYDLLEAEEKQLFARLAVFAGGCALEAAEDVTDADLDILQSLVDKSLLRRTNERFSMLETIREYALERLQASGEAEELRRRHAAYFLALAEEARPHLNEVARQAEWLDRLDVDLDNLRSAFTWASTSDDRDVMLEVATALGEFWYARGHYAEGLRWLDGALACDLPTNEDLRARAAAMALQLAGKIGTAEDEQRYAAMLRSWASETTGSLDAKSLLLLAHAIDGVEHHKLLWAAAEQARSAGDVAVLARALVNLGLDDLAADNFAQAERRVREARQVSLEGGAYRETARALNVLGEVRSYVGDPVEARALHEEALQISQRVNFKEGQAYALEGLAHAHAALDEHARAARCFAEAVALEEEIGLRLDAHVERRRPETVAKIRAGYRAASAAEANQLACGQVLGTSSGSAGSTAGD